MFVSLRLQQAGPANDNLPEPWLLLGVNANTRIAADGTLKLGGSCKKPQVAVQHCVAIRRLPCWNGNQRVPKRDKAGSGCAETITIRCSDIRETNNEIISNKRPVVMRKAHHTLASPRWWNSGDESQQARCRVQELPGAQLALAHSRTGRRVFEPRQHERAVGPLPS